MAASNIYDTSRLLNSLTAPEYNSDALRTMNDSLTAREALSREAAKSLENVGTNVLDIGTGLQKSATDQLKYELAKASRAGMQLDPVTGLPIDPTGSNLVAIMDRARSGRDNATGFDMAGMVDLNALDQYQADKLTPQRRAKAKEIRDSIEFDRVQKLRKELDPAEINKANQDVTKGGLEIYQELQKIDFDQNNNPQIIAKNKQLVENAKLKHDQQIQALAQAKLEGPLSIENLKLESKLKKQTIEFDRIARSERVKDRRLERKQLKLEIRKAKSYEAYQKILRARAEKTAIRTDKLNARADKLYEQNEPVRAEKLRQEIRTLKRNEKDWQDKQLAKQDKTDLIKQAGPNDTRTYAEQLKQFNDLETKYRDADYSPENMKFLDRERTRLMQNADYNVTSMLDDLIPAVDLSIYADSTGQLSTDGGINLIPTKYFTAQVKKDLNEAMLDKLQKDFPGSTRTSLQPTASRILNQNTRANIKFNETEKNTANALAADDLLRAEGLSSLKNDSVTELEIQKNPIFHTSEAIRSALAAKKVVLEEADIKLLDKDLPNAIDKVKSIFTDLDSVNARALRLASYQMFKNVQFKDGFWTIDAFRIDGKDIADMTNNDYLRALKRYAPSSLKDVINAKLKTQSQSVAQEIIEESTNEPAPDINKSVEKQRNNLNPSELDTIIKTGKQLYNALSPSASTIAARNNPSPEELERQKRAIQQFVNPGR